MLSLPYPYTQTASSFLLSHGRTQTHLQWQGTLRDYTENEVSFYTYIAVSLIHSDLC